MAELLKQKRMKILAKLELLLIGMWLGAACFFSFGMAPTAFGVLPTPELAGNLVNRTLMIVNLGGFAIGVLALILSFVPRTDTGTAWIWIRRILLFVFTLATGAGHFVIAMWLGYLRSFMAKPLAELAANDPLKIQFDQLHQASVWVLVAAMIAALLAFFVVSRGEQANKTGKKAVETDFDFSNEFKI